MPLAALILATLPTVTFSSLLSEVGDRDALAQWPNVEYQSLQASSYNRESVHRDKPGWFADSDGTGYIRRDENGEYVMMEHVGPGCITKVWTPFFYYDFNERKGPNVRIYLDGNPQPVFDESLIELVCGKGSVPAPWAAFSARAGNLYIPIPFGKSAKVTMKQKPFYNIVNYRAYPHGTRVETFRPEYLQTKKLALDEAVSRLSYAPSTRGLAALSGGTLTSGGMTAIELPPGPRAVTKLTIELPDAKSRHEVLRSLVISATFDGRETVWCPIGDLFCSADQIHPFQTFSRTVAQDGKMTLSWVMPYAKTGQLKVMNFSRTPSPYRISAEAVRWKWDKNSMHFYARWRPDDVVPGTPFSDWNFVDIKGKGVFVGDAWTVLNIRKDSWWGEGDEKIYVDDAWEKGFPTHFGTGTEDYYGWAGGVYPDLKDEFSAPFLANVKVGGLDGHTQGYNICTRVRGLDAIPFQKRLRFDMESSFGTDMREKWNLLGYSAVTFFYALPGATHNRPAQPKEAAKPIMSTEQLQKLSDQIRAGS